MLSWLKCKSEGDEGEVVKDTGKGKGNGDCDFFDDEFWKYAVFFDDMYALCFKPYDYRALCCKLV